jgi:hypothetical protein
MKYKVKVGASFELDICDEQTLAANAIKQPASSRSLREVATAAIVIIGSGVLFGTVIYGVFTGDFSLMESVWNAVKTYIPGMLKNHSS